MKMDIEEMQEKSWKIVEEYNKKHNLKHNKITTFHHLVEEIGELAKELHNENNEWRAKFDKEKMQKELIDVIYQALILAKDYDVDVEKVFNNKIDELKKRYGLEY